MPRLCRQIALLCLLLAPPAFADVQITLRDGVLVNGSEYVLGDVASVQSGDAALSGYLRGVALGDTPRPGQSVALTQFAVSARLERVLPGMAARIEWRGEPMVRVRGTTVERDASLVTDMARQALIGWLRERHQGVEVGIERVGEAAPLYTPAGDADLVARLSESARLRSRMPVWIDVKVDGRTVNTTPVWFAVAAYTHVAVANEDLSRHAPVTAAQVVYERRDIAGLAAAPLADVLPERHRATRKIAEGDIIVSTALEPIPQVQRGQFITVHARHGRVALSVEALALADGNLDEPVLVESLTSRVAYRAIVSGDGEATVE